MKTVTTEVTVRLSSCSLHTALIIPTPSDSPCSLFSATRARAFIVHAHVADRQRPHDERYVFGPAPPKQFKCLHPAPGPKLDGLFSASTY